MRIIMYAANLRHWGKLYPNAPFADVPSPAGTELAMLGVARGLARVGHRVTVFANCDGGSYDGVDYLSAEFAIPYLTTLDTDVVVSWQDASIFLYPLKTKLRVLMSQSSQLGLGQAAGAVDRYFAISRYSAQLLLESDAYADPDKLWITRNGHWPSRFNDGFPIIPTGRNHHQLVWMSSPDRGLHHLVPIFRLVRQRVPDATLAVCYEFDKTYESYKTTQPSGAYTRFLERARALKEEPGVEVVNHLSQPRLASLLMESGIMAYSCDPVRPTETYCNAVNEAMAAGMPVVISDADCLPENYGDFAAAVLPRPINHQDWANAIIQLMTDEEVYRDASYRSQRLAAQTSYDDVAREWEAFFQGYLTGNEVTPDRSLASVLELTTIDHKPLLEGIA